jgi:hypothetical protein
MVVDHSTPNPKIKGLNPAEEREQMLEKGYIRENREY